MRQPGQAKRGCLFAPALEAFHQVVWRPAVDVYRTRTGWLVKFELAGVRVEEIGLKIQGKTLSVQGVRRDCVVEESCHHYSLEIAYSKFERPVEFPVSLEGAEITTEYQAGMLLVRIQLEEERP